MSRRFVVAAFADEHDILGATRAARERGYTIVDTYTPFAVHGMDDAMGLKRSLLPWVCLGCGLTGAAAKLWFQVWTSGTSWPVNVGGKPLASIPAFVPVTFEITVLFAGVGVVLAFFVARRLWPGKRPPILLERATDDRFLLVIEESSAEFDLENVRSLFRRFHVVRLEERVEGSERVIEVSGAVQ